MQTETLVLTSLMTALVVVLQCLATYTAFFGPFSTAIALIPIIIGAAMCGPAVGAWLGFVFGVVVLITGGGNLFFMFSIPGTVITVIVKGTLCGLASGLTYRLFERFGKTAAAISAAITCPLVNTAVFLLGCLTFFMSSAERIAEMLGLDVSGMAVFVALASENFLFEIGMCALLSPVIIRVIGFRKNKK